MPFMAVSQPGRLAIMGYDLEGESPRCSQPAGAGKSRSLAPSKIPFTFPERQWRKFIAERGSVALNGVSLTVAEVSASWFAVEIIPQTLATTNLKLLRLGERLNIERDMIGKYL